MYPQEWLGEKWSPWPTHSERTGTEALCFCLLWFIFTAKYTRLVHNMGSLAKTTDWAYDHLQAWSGRSYPLIFTIIHYFLHTFAEKNTEMETSRLRSQSQKADCLSDEVYDMAISLIFITCNYFYMQQKTKRDDWRLEKEFSSLVDRDAMNSVLQLSRQ